MGPGQLDSEKVGRGGRGGSGFVWVSVGFEGPGVGGGVGEWGEANGQ